VAELVEEESRTVTGAMSYVALLNEKLMIVPQIYNPSVVSTLNCTMERLKKYSRREMIDSCIGRVGNAEDKVEMP